MNAVHNNRYADILTHGKGMERVLAWGGGWGGGVCNHLLTKAVPIFTTATQLNHKAFTFKQCTDSVTVHKASEHEEVGQKNNNPKNTDWVHR